MNQDVQNMDETGSGMLSDRLVWDWRNPLTALPLAAITVLAASALVMLMKLIGA